MSGQRFDRVAKQFDNGLNMQENTSDERCRLGLILFPMNENILVAPARGKTLIIMHQRGAVFLDYTGVARYGRMTVTDHRVEYLPSDEKIVDAQNPRHLRAASMQFYGSLGTARRDMGNGAFDNADDPISKLVDRNKHAGPDHIVLRNYQLCQRPLTPQKYAGRFRTRRLYSGKFPRFEAIGSSIYKLDGYDLA